MNDPAPMPRLHGIPFAAEDRQIDPGEVRSEAGAPDDVGNVKAALRSGDTYVEHARRYADPNTYLIPLEVWPAQREEVIRLTDTPADGAERLRELERELRHLAERVERLLAERDGWLRREKGNRNSLS